MSRQCRTCERPAAKGRKECLSCHGRRRRGTPVTEPKGPRILLLDIETSLQLSYHFGRWNVNIHPEMNVEPTRMLCVAAKWLGEEGSMFWSEWQHGSVVMVEAIWRLLSEADAVVHYYGSRFDVPHLNREFLLGGFPPPSPYRQIDLKLAAAKRFKFDSNKLEFVAQALGVGGKLKHEGAMLWRKVQEGDAAAQDRMEAYNRRDTEMLEDVYDALLPWLPNPLNRHLYGGKGCPTCGGEVARDGEYHTALSVFPQYRCTARGCWSRGNKRISGAGTQAAVLS